MAKKQAKTIVLIDAHALIHRAFHALPPLNSPDGQLVNAVYGFSSLLIKMLRELKPEFVLAAYDLAGPTFRHEAYAGYKAQRPKAPEELYSQVEITRRILKAFGIEVLEKDGYEADDIIGSLVRQFKKGQHNRVIIVSGDLDTLQLVDKNQVAVYTLKKGLRDTVIYTQKEVQTRYGLSPGQLADFRGLKGDPSDNIPGVPGIGEKTASALLKKFKDIDGLYRALKKPLPDTVRAGYNISTHMREKLLSYEDQARFSRELAKIVQDLNLEIDLQDARWHKRVDIEAIKHLFHKYGFISLIPRLQNLGLPQDESMPSPSSFTKPGITVFRINSGRDFDNFAVQIKQAKTIAFDFSSDFKQLYMAILPQKIVFSLIFKKPAQQLLKDISENGQQFKIVYDLKSILKFLFQSEFKHDAAKMSWASFFDISIASWLLQPELKQMKLEQLCYQELNQPLPAQPAELPLYLFRLQVLATKKLRQYGLMRVFQNLEMPLIAILAKMEQQGIGVDKNALADLTAQVVAQLHKLETDIYQKAGMVFNINSPQQLGEILFKRIGIVPRGMRKTPLGARSTAASELDKLYDVHPVVPLVLEYRELTKLQNTYLEPFGRFITRDNRIHTTFLQTGTVTGRLASVNPNLQNIPIRTELGQEFRKIFIAEQGYQLLSLDYSQIELRILAHLSQDTKLIAAFNADEDIHTRTAAAVFEVLPEQVTSQMRRQAKMLNFGIIYGMGVGGFSRAAGVSRERAQEFITRYFEEFRGAAEYLDQTKKEARERGYVTTLFGRRRYLPQITSSMPQLARQAERMAINMPIQGSDADIMKKAMIEVSRYLTKQKLDTQVRMLLQVHDELLFEVRTELINQISTALLNIMQRAYRLSVPLKVDAKTGINWAELKPV